MTNQIQGEILFKGWGGGTSLADWVFTPWMPVRGDKATFGVEIFYISSSTALTWNVQTRTLETPIVQATDNQLFTTDEAPSAPGVKIVEADGINDTTPKQLLRYQFCITGGASASDRVHFRALAPSWQVDR